MNVSIRETPLQIVSMGLVVPPTIESAADLAPRLGRSKEWIEGRTGVSERRVAHETMAEMAAAAVREAVGDGPRPDLLINASLTPMQLAPDSSVFILRQLGWHGTPGFSLHATCLSFLDALPVVAGLLDTRAFPRVVVVSAERGSVCRDFGEPESAALIGDGAAAAVFATAPTGGPALLGHAMGTWPDGADLAGIEGFGERHPPYAADTSDAHHRFHMRGPAVYRFTRSKVSDLLDALLSQLGMTAADIDVVVPHQASGPALASLERLGFPADKVVNIVGWAGNCIAASLPMAMAVAVRDGRLAPGRTVLLLGTGAGVSVSAAVLRW